MSQVTQERAIGRLEGKIDILIAAQVTADEARGKTNEKLDHLGNQQGLVKRDVEEIKGRLNAVEAPVAELWKWHERLVVAMMLIGLASAAIGTAITWAWNKIFEIFNG